MRVYSRPDDGDDAWVCHATGILTPEPTAVPEGLIGAWPASGSVPVEVEGFYERMADAGYAYGPAFQGLRSVWRDGDDLLAEVALPEAAGSRDGYGIHPALLDAALHPALLLDWDGEQQDDGKVWLPFTWNRVGLWAAGADTVRVRVSPGEHDATERELRLLVTDAAGTNVLSVGSVTLRPADVGQLKSARDDDGLFTVRWTPLPLPATATEDGSDSGDEAPWAVVAPVEAGGDGLAAAERVLSLVQEFLAAPQPAESRLLLVTRGAVATEDDSDSDIDPAAASVWGLVRSAQSEHPGRFVLVDTDADDLPLAALRYAVEELDEPQLALRDGTLLIPRLVRATGGPAVGSPGERAWRLETSGTGTLEGVAPVVCPELVEPLAPGQVRLEVRAAGINFRDVLVSLGMVPGQTGLGGEGAGVVTEVGPDVTHLAVGDQVMGVLGGSFGPVAVADTRMVA
ncbi:polyketide synthase dehydratase domain-containing protein, partial [Streptomyces mobaraensis]|uniref:polyketide synthase dehydratase domain-containing protein n=1 Tax=Streptomyces mobaraensis TaxID=35621 RepID=UPI001F046E6E